MSLSIVHHNRSRLLKLKTLSVGQADDLKLETTSSEGTLLRYWVSRVGLDDGARMDNMVTVEHLRGGRWCELTTY